MRRTNGGDAPWHRRRIKSCAMIVSKFGGAFNDVSSNVHRIINEFNSLSFAVPVPQLEDVRAPIVALPSFSLPPPSLSLSLSLAYNEQNFTDRFTRSLARSAVASVSRFYEGPSRARKTLVWEKGVKRKGKKEEKAGKRKVKRPTAIGSSRISRAFPEIARRG